MAFTRRSIELLLDLVENKISFMDTDEREAARDLKVLMHCRSVLRELIGQPAAPVASLAALRRIAAEPRATAH